MDKQAYKMKLPRKLKIHNVFYMSLLEQNITKKRWVNNNNIMAHLQLDKVESKEYEIKVICDNKLYANKWKSHLPGLYYLVF